MTTIRARAAAALNLTEQQGNSLVGAGILIALAAAAAATRGLQGAVIAVLAGQIYLLCSRANQALRIDEARDETDQARAVCDLLAGRIQALADHLGVTIYDADVSDNWAELEEAATENDEPEPDTDEIPVVGPDTQPTEAVISQQWAELDIEAQYAEALAALDKIARVEEAA